MSKRGFEVRNTFDTLFCDRTSPGYLNDNHPTAYGHKQMADIIMAAINA